NSPSSSSYSPIWSPGDVANGQLIVKPEFVVFLPYSSEKISDISFRWYFIASDRFLLFPLLSIIRIGSSFFDIAQPDIIPKRLGIDPQKSMCPAEYLDFDGFLGGFLVSHVFSGSGNFSWVSSIPIFILISSSFVEGAWIFISKPRLIPLLIPRNSF